MAAKHRYETKILRRYHPMHLHSNNENLIKLHVSVSFISFSVVCRVWSVRSLLTG